MTDHSAADPSGLLSDPLLRDAPTVEGFKVLDPAVLYAKIGEGGMGAVYRGRHLTLDLDVAVKCLQPALAAGRQDFIRRFEREARLAASITHQNIVRVMHVQEKNGIHYLVMEFVRGETARERVKRKQAKGLSLSEREALAILLGAATGLAEAHARGIVHRDIKPDNVMISVEGRVKLADLGLAKASGGAVDGASIVMHTAAIMGTPQYMPPEQWDSSDVGPAADVWALGATFYYLLAGRSGIAAGALTAVARRTQEQDFPTLRAERSDLRPEVHALFERCVRRDPAERFADARALLKALRPLVVDDEEVLLDPDTGTGAARAAMVTPPPKQTLFKIRATIETRPGTVADRTVPTLPQSATSPPPPPPATMPMEPSSRDVPQQAAGRPVRKPRRVGKIAVGVAVLLLGGGAALGYTQGWFVRKPAEQDEAAHAKWAEIDRNRREAEMRKLTVAPVPPFTNADKVSITGTVFQGGTTLTTTKRIVDLTRKLKVGEKVVSPAMDGTFATTVDLPKDDTYTIVIAATDHTGTVQQEIKVRRHTQPPVLQWVSPDVSQPLAAGPVRITGTVASALPNVAVTVNSSLVEVRDGKWTVSLIHLDRDLRVVVKAVDAAGNAGKDLVVLLRGKVTFATRIETGIGLSMIAVQARTFAMGSPDSEPERGSDETLHTVKITKQYWLAETEVTQKQWRAVMGTEPWKGDAYAGAGDDVAASRLDWNAAVTFCEDLTTRERAAGRVPDGFGYCLPTEAQWELACRAGSRTSYAFGDLSSMLHEYAVFADARSGDFVHAVKQRRANAWGFFDLHGNVWEWCADEVGSTRDSLVASDTYRDGIEDPCNKGGTHRVLRGGSWLDPAKSCRSAVRFGLVPRGRGTFGLRPALAAR